MNSYSWKRENLGFHTISGPNYLLSYISIVSSWKKWQDNNLIDELVRPAFFLAYRLDLEKTEQTYSTHTWRDGVCVLYQLEKQSSSMPILALHLQITLIRTVASKSTICSGSSGVPRQSDPVCHKWLCKTSEDIMSLEVISAGFPFQDSVSSTLPELRHKHHDLVLHILFHIPVTLSYPKGCCLGVTVAHGLTEWQFWQSGILTMSLDSSKADKSSSREKAIQRCSDTT